MPLILSGLESWGRCGWGPRQQPVGSGASRWPSALAGGRCSSSPLLAEAWVPLVLQRRQGCEEEEWGQAECHSCSQSQWTGQGCPVLHAQVWWLPPTQQVWVWNGVCSWACEGASDRLWTWRVTRPHLRFCGQVPPESSLMSPFPWGWTSGRTSGLSDPWRVRCRDFPGGAMLKNLLCSVGDTGLILGKGTKIPACYDPASWVTKKKKKKSIYPAIFTCSR